MVVDGRNETISKVTPVSARRKGKHDRRKYLRSLVEQELRSRRTSQVEDEQYSGMAVDDNHDEDHLTTTPIPMEGIVRTIEQDDRIWKDFSEEELLEFLHELEQDDEEILDQRLVAWMEELEQQYLEEQLLSEYEQQSSDVQVVSCPLCFHGKLQKLDNVIVVCSNHTQSLDNGSSCSFRLHTEYSLHELQERLRFAFEEHGSACRQSPRAFQMDDDTLSVVCSLCGIHQSIV